MKTYLVAGIASLLGACSLIVAQVNPDACDTNRCDGTQFIECVNSLEANPVDCALTNEECDAQVGCVAQGEPVCGNNTQEAGEVCDGTDLNGQDCASQAPGSSGTLACDADCLGFDTSGCVGGEICGNNIVEGNEECDDGCDVITGACSSADDGDGCDQNCRLEAPGCDGGAPNDTIDSLGGGDKEPCDSDEFDVFSTCEQIGFGSGTLGCNDDCGFDTSLCIPP